MPLRWRTSEGISIVLLIECPYCGCRDESEFVYGGEADISRPTNSEALSDEQWADYVFMRKNPKGAHSELWQHAQGCRQWFRVNRDTLSYAMTSGEKIKTNDAQ